MIGQDKQRPDACPLDQIEHWVFDLDNTLYPADCRLFDQIDRRMGEFISDFLGVEPKAAKDIQKRFFLNYGTTLNGLMQVHGLAPQRFLDYVHDIDLSPLPDANGLDAALGGLPGVKWIYTNASSRHAENVLGYLGIMHHFAGIFDIVAAGFQPKPHIDPYRTLIDRYAITASTAAMIEDIARNLEPAAELGMTTVWVPSGAGYDRVGADGGHIDHIVRDLPAWLAEISAGGRIANS